MFQTTGLPLPSPRFLFRTVAVKAKFHTRAHVVCGFEVGCPGSAPIVTHKTRTEVVTKEILIISIILFKMTHVIITCITFQLLVSYLNYLYHFQFTISFSINYIYFLEMI